MHLALRPVLSHRFSLLLVHDYSKLEVMWHGNVAGDTWGAAEAGEPAMVRDDRSPHAPDSLRVSSEGTGTKIHLKEHPAQIKGPVDNE